MGSIKTTLAKAIPLWTFARRNVELLCLGGVALVAVAFLCKPAKKHEETSIQEIIKLAATPNTEVDTLLNAHQKTVQRPSPTEQTPSAQTIRVTMIDVFPVAEKPDTRHLLVSNGKELLLGEIENPEILGTLLRQELTPGNWFQIETTPGTGPELLRRAADMKATPVWIERVIR